MLSNQSGEQLEKVNTNNSGGLRCMRTLWKSAVFVAPIATYERALSTNLPSCMCVHFVATWSLEYGLYAQCSVEPCSFMLAFKCMEGDRSKSDKLNVRQIKQNPLTPGGITSGILVLLWGNKEIMNACCCWLHRGRGGRVEILYRDSAAIEECFRLDTTQCETSLTYLIYHMVWILISLVRSPNFPTNYRAEIYVFSRYRPK